MLRKTLIILPLAVVLLLCIFWQSIAGSLLQTCINSYCLNHFGSELQTERIYKKDGFWVFENPVVHQNASRLAADRLLLSIGISPTRRLVDLEVFVEGSQIDLREELSSLEEVVQQILSNSLPFWIFNIQSKITVDEGTIIWYEGEQTNVSGFHFYARSESDSTKACLALSLDGKNSETNFFELLVTKDKVSPLQAELTFREVDCSKISRIYEGLGHNFGGWEIKEGMVNGKIHVKRPESKRSYAWGDATLTGLVFAHQQMKVSGNVQEAKFDLEAERRGKKHVPQILGKVEISKEASLSLHRNGVPYWELKDLLGGVYFVEDEGVKVDVQGLCKHDAHRFGLKIEGKASIFDETQAAIDVVARLSSPEKDDALAHFVARQLGDLYDSAEIEINNFGKDEFRFIQTALSKYFPDFQSLQMHEGSIDASGIVYLQGLRPIDIKIDNIDAHDLQFDLNPLDLSLRIGETSGNFSVNLNHSSPLETLQADFSINDGHLKFLGFNDQTWRFGDISTHFAIRNGVIQKSEMQGEFSGLKGTILVDWMSPDDVVKINFSGDLEKITHLMPNVIKTGVEKSFPNDHVSLMAGMARGSSGAKLTGKLEVSRDDTEPGDTIDFGFDIEKCSEKLWRRWPADDIAISYWENVGQEAMQKVMPPIVSPTVLFEANWIRSESGIAGLVVRKGWFHAKNLSFERYLSPFIFPKNQMELSGVGSFRGAFSHNRMAVEYEGENITLENPYLTVEAKGIKSLENSEKHSKFMAAHYFDFHKGTHFGSIPLVNATYFEKNSGMLFTDIKALVTLEGQKVHISDLEAQTNGIFLAGGVDIDFQYPDDGYYDVEIRAHNLVGKVSQVQQLFSHFNPELAFLSLPLEGDVSFCQKGGVLSLAFKPDDYEIQADIVGRVSNGTMAFEETQPSLHDIKLDFAYHHAARTLEFTNIHGDLQAGDAQDSENFQVVGEYLRFTDLEKNMGEFDIWLGNQARDVIRLVGKTLPRIDGEESLIEFHIDHNLTHFGDVHPGKFQLILQDWTDVKTFQLSLNVRLNTLLRDLQRFSRSGLFLSSRNISKKINHLSRVSGELSVDLQYDREKAELAYHLKGDDITIDDFISKKCRLKGTKSGDYWSIHKLQLDDLLISAYVRPLEKSWKVSKLMVQSGDMMTMELDGQFDGKDNALECRVSHLELDLEKLKGDESLIKAFVEKCSPHGKITGNGEVRIEFLRGIPSWRADAILDVALHSCDIRGLHFQDVQNVSCHFVSDRGITLRNLNTHLVVPGLQAARALVNIEKTYYEFLTGELYFDKLHFNAPSHHLPWIADTLAQSFPKLIVPTVADVIRGAKLQGNVEGSLQFEMTPPYTALRLSLKEGRYQFLNNEHDFKHFVLEYDPFEFKVTSQYHLAGNHVWLYVRSTSPTLNFGELVLTDLSPENYSKRDYKEALFILWENDSKNGFSVVNADGAFAGLNMQLQRDPTEPLSDEALFLVGQVDVNALNAKTLFPEEMAQKVKDWGVGDGYQLKGKWRLQKNSSQDYANKLHFLGTLSGKNFVFKGYQFDTLAAHLEYTPNSIRMRELSVNDVSGALSAEKFDMVIGADKHWYFSMPLMHVNKFRPVLLQEAGQPRINSKKPFFIRELTLEGCQGSLADSTSIIGKGRLHFSNRAKKLLQNTIFQIPADIISRIGLDPSVLTPVTGTIDYSIRDGKIYLTKFKDIYSEGKLSKFILSSASPSYMDFDSNLNVQVRMRQYNLLFKLTEPFTVNIRGNLQKPTYSLTKQRREDTVSNK